MQIDTSYRTFFEESNTMQYKARTLMVDTEPNIIGDIKIHQYLQYLIMII